MNCIAIVPVGGNWCLARKLHLKGSSFMVEMIIDLKRVENKFLPSSTFDGVECESHKKCFYGARETSGSTLTWRVFDCKLTWVKIEFSFLKLFHTHTPHHLPEKVIVRFIRLSGWLFHSFTFAYSKFLMKRQIFR